MIYIKFEYTVDSTWSDGIDVLINKAFKIDESSLVEAIDDNCSEKVTEKEVTELLGFHIDIMHLSPGERLHDFAMALEQLFVPSERSSYILHSMLFLLSEEAQGMFADREVSEEIDPDKTIFVCADI